MLAVVSFSVYANTLQGDFVWDDRALFVEHYDLWQWNNLKQLLTSQDNLFGDRYTGYYRPFSNLTFLLDRYIWGPDPLGYHLTNIVFHVLSTIAVFFMAKALFGSLYIGVASGLLFAVHPIHTEVVAWVNGRNNVISGLFYLLSFYYYVLYRNDKKTKIFVLSLISFACSLFSKEYALTFPMMMLLYEFSYYSEAFRSKRSLKRLGMLTIPYFLIIMGYLLIRSLVLPMHGIKSLHLETLWVRLMTLPKTVLIYLKLLAFPFNLTVSHNVSLIEHPLQFEFLFQVIMLAALLFLWRWSFRRSKTLFFSVGWILITLLPVLNIIPLSDTTDTFLAERYLYLPSVGFCMASGWVLMQLSRLKFATSFKIGRYVAAGLLLITIEVYGFQAARRNLVWRNELALWKDAAKKSPDHFLPHINLAINLERAGELDEALDEANIAIRLNPDDETLYFVLCQILYKKGLFEQSLDAVKKALELEPNHVDGLNVKGNIHFRMGRFDEALSCYREVVRLSPSHLHGQNNLGLVLYKLGRFDEAISVFNKSIQTRPMAFKPYYYLAQIYEARGDRKKAIDFYRASLRHTQDPIREKALQEKIRKLDREQSFTLKRKSGKGDWQPLLRFWLNMYN